MSGAAIAGAAPAQNAGELVASFKAPLLERILDGEGAGERQVVLDLGAASPPLLERLSSNRPGCRVEIADFVVRGGLSAIRALEALEDPGPIQRLLPEASERPLDLILCWDLPNYLSIETLNLLFGIFAVRAGPGCQLHMLIAYGNREMPALPARYTLGANGLLRQTRASDAMSGAPRYSPEDLSRAVHGFRYRRGILLANGMQEFLYAWPEPPSVRKR